MGSRKVRGDQHYILNRKVRKAFILIPLFDVEMVLNVNLEQRQNNAEKVYTLFIWKVAR